MYEEYLKGVDISANHTPTEDIMCNKSEDKYEYSIVQNLGEPSVFPPKFRGKIQAAVQFIIPELKLGKEEKKKAATLAHKCSTNVHSVDIREVENNRTKNKATFATIAFYVDVIGNQIGVKEITSASYMLVERYLGLLSLIMGTRLSRQHMQCTFAKEADTHSKIMPTTYRSPIDKIEIKSLNFLDAITLDDYVFSALFWLRRGLAERDHLETFSALMVCLQIMARHLVKQEPITNSCPHCGAELDFQHPSTTTLMRELIISKLGEPPELFNRLWRARNATVSHGNLTITADVLLEITELRLKAIDLSFRAIKLGLGTAVDAPPFPNKALFITDALMPFD